MTAAEVFLVRLEGGPLNGETRIANFACPADEPMFTWPLPDVLNMDSGRYVKVSESDLPPQTEGSHLMRGAIYEWDAAQ